MVGMVGMICEFNLSKSAASSEEGIKAFLRKRNKFPKELEHSLSDCYLLRKTRNTGNLGDYAEGQ